MKPSAKPQIAAIFATKVNIAVIVVALREGGTNSRTLA